MLKNLSAEPLLFHLAPVRPGSVDRSFVLARLFEPRLDRSAWRSYVRHRSRGEAGVMAVGDERGYVHGVFSWCVDRALIPDRVLQIRDLILLKLPGQALQMAVVGQIADLAQAKSCRQIYMGFEKLSSGLAVETLESLGFRQAGQLAFMAELSSR